ncbi:hypothetical protein HJG60_011656 [Phyllostomus discolor]|uniref:Uncharacterized protein n=1 Tax=Phyllostomus discolor TaxID=89673 RepID=A0A834DXJ7_9CHIR|nr:hypothetical protein HJG60_011656 [Phyllostomus discolor]
MRWRGLSTWHTACRESLADAAVVHTAIVSSPPPPPLSPSPSSPASSPAIASSSPPPPPLSPSPSSLASALAIASASSSPSPLPSSSPPSPSPPSPPSPSPPSPQHHHGHHGHTLRATTTIICILTSHQHHCHHHYLCPVNVLFFFAFPPLSLRCNGPTAVHWLQVCDTTVAHLHAQRSGAHSRPRYCPHLTPYTSVPRDENLPALLSCDSPTKHSIIDCRRQPVR